MNYIITYGKGMVYNLACLHKSDWTADNKRLKFQLRFPYWPAAACMCQKDHVKQRSYAKSYLLVKIVRPLHCSSIQLLTFCLTMYKEPQNKSIDIMVSFKLSFFFCEFFIIKVGFHKWLGYEHIWGQTLWHLPRK